jgi:hypothetical protein
MRRWLGHVKGMEAGAIPRRMMVGRLFTGRRKEVINLTVTTTEALHYWI